MKYLKLFEELKSQTYNQAAAKLKQMGHQRRSKELYDWSSVVQKREALERWSKLGTFGRTFYQTKWNSSTKTSTYNHLFDGQFYIGLEVDEDYIWERFYDFEYNLESKQPFWILFRYGVYPANQETHDRMFSIEHIKNNSWNDGYWESNLSIKLSENRFELFPRAEVYFEAFENLTYMPSNRKEALKLHRLLVNLMEQKIELPVVHGTISKLRAMIEEKTKDKGLWNRMTETVKKMPLNYLYRD